MHLWNVKRHHRKIARKKSDDYRSAITMYNLDNFMRQVQTQSIIVYATEQNSSSSNNKNNDDDDDDHNNNNNNSNSNSNSNNNNSNSNNNNNSNNNIAPSPAPAFFQLLYCQVSPSWSLHRNLVHWQYSLTSPVFPRSQCNGPLHDRSDPGMPQDVEDSWDLWLEHLEV